MTFSAEPRVTSIQRTANARRSSAVSEWLSPVLPQMNANFTPLAERWAACFSTIVRLSEPSAWKGECVAATRPVSG